MLHDVPRRTFVLVATKYVVPPARFHEAPYYELVIAPTHDSDVARTTVITRDAALATRALALEGTDARLEIHWQILQVPRRRFVVTSLHEARA